MRFIVDYGRVEWHRTFARAFRGVETDLNRFQLLSNDVSIQHSPSLVETETFFPIRVYAFLMFTHGTGDTKLIINSQNFDLIL